MSETEIKFTLNGEPVTVECPESMTLLKLLREKLDLTGAKAGCERGECGACTVLLDGAPVNSCLVLAPQVEGREVLTIEGLSRGEELAAFCRERLAGFKVPRHFRFLEALPKTGSGKIDKKALRRSTLRG